MSPYPDERVAPPQRIVVVDAPSNLGLSPPSPGAIPGCWRLAEVLRQQGIVTRLGASDGRNNGKAVGF